VAGEIDFGSIPEDDDLDFGSSGNDIDFGSDDDLDQEEEQWERINWFGKVVDGLIRPWQEAAVEVGIADERGASKEAVDLIGEMATSLTNGEALLRGVDTTFSPISAPAAGIKSVILGDSFQDGFTNRVAQATGFDKVIDSNVRDFSETPEDKHFRQVREGTVDGMNDAQMLGLVATDIAEVLLPGAKGKSLFLKPGEKFVNPILTKGLQKGIDVSKKAANPKEIIASLRGTTAKVSDDVLKENTPKDDLGFWRKGFRSVGANIKTMGDEGKELAERMSLAETKPEVSAGKLIEDMRQNFKGLSKGEMDQVVDVLDGQISLATVSDKVKKVAIAERGRLNNVSQRAASILEDNSLFRDNYFPHMFDARELGKASFKTKAIKEMVASGKYASETDALKAFSEHTKGLSGRKFGNLEKTRLNGASGWERNPIKALSRYYQRAERRISEAQYLGVNDNIANKLIDGIRVKGYDADFALRNMERFVGKNQLDSSTAQFLSAVSSFETVTKLGLSQITNAPQGLVNTAFNSNIKTAIKAFGKSFLPEGRAFGRRSGATLSSTIDELAQIGSESTAHGSIASKFLKLNGFTAVETQNRIMSAIAGKMRAEWAMDVLQSAKSKTHKLREAKDVLLELGIDAEKALQRGVLSGDELLEAGLRFSNKTQFRSGVLDLPEFFKSPWGRVLTQFKSFAFHHAKFVADVATKDARAVARGDLKRLPNFLSKIGFAAAVGEIPIAVKSILKGKDPAKREADLLRFAENLGAVGGLGILSDIHNSVLHGKSGMYSFLGGPFVGDVVQTGQNVLQPFAKGEFEKGGKNLLIEPTRFIPGFGRQIHKSLKK